MKTPLCMALLLLCANAAQAQQTPAYGCDSAESRQLDFWLGTWELTYAGTDGKPAKSTNRVSKTLDGCVVLEEFTGAPGTRLDGRSYSTYDRAARKWKQTWVDNTGGYLDFEGATVDGNRAFARVAQVNGKASHQRMVFREVKADSLRWIWETSPDGKQWKTAWDIAYRRVK